MRPAAVNRQRPFFYKAIPEADTDTLLCHPDILQCPVQSNRFCDMADRDRICCNSSVNPP
ncbi:hypothetical protein [Methanogenium cariaci]|uniref:hypothetical protein n=1 Tax=Methanogenium cariaci TaxID=2197 RepID=UPI0012F67A5A|nr:hypothetical protein [Methanogenium cariaci]